MTTDSAYGLGEARRQAMLTILRRTEREERIDRWYLVAVQASLFDSVTVITAWGSRQTAWQQVRVTPMDSPEAAAALAARIVAGKLKRGYEPVAG